MKEFILNVINQILDFGLILFLRSYVVRLSRFFRPPKNANEPIANVLKLWDLTRKGDLFVMSLVHFVLFKLGF